jgi:hypothetical protein
MTEAPDTAFRSLVDAADALVADLISYGMSYVVGPLKAATDEARAVLNGDAQ